MIGSQPEPESDAVVDAALLHTLLYATTPITRASLAGKHNWSLSRLAGELDRLIAARCELDRGDAITLMRTGLSAWSDYLTWCDRRTGREPREIEVYRSTSSTQDVTRRLIEARGPAAHRCVAIADEQTSGRGRLGRRWVGPRGSTLMASVGIIHSAVDDISKSVDHLMLAACIATTRAIEAVAPSLAVTIKWPNDLQIAGRKLAGILVETFQSPRHTDAAAAIVGIGINVSATAADLAACDTDLATHATSLAIADVTVDRLLLLSHLLAELDQALVDASHNELVEAWRRRSALLGQWVVLHHDRQRFAGEVVDLDPEQGLVLRLANGSFAHLPAATTTFHEEHS